MITKPWADLPSCCLECRWIKMSGKKYKCGVNLIFPTRKRSCLKQDWRKKPVVFRLVEFMSENGISSQFLDARRRYPSRYKKAKPWDFFVMAFDLHAIDKDEWVPWAYASTLWRIILEMEYPEHVRGWESNLVSPKKKARGKYKEHIKSRFKRFLVETGAFDNWIYERKRLPWKQKPTIASRIIFNAFFWKDTFDGYNYWQSLHLGWEHIVKTEYPEYIPK